MNYLTRSKEETQEIGHTLARQFKPGSLVTLTGELGAGKTTLVQGMLKELGAERPFVSPTFVLMKQYELKSLSSTGIRRIYHADAYRIEAHDFETLGFAEWCADPEGLVLLEWPERIKNLLPEKRVEISLRSLSETERNILVEKSTV